MKKRNNCDSDIINYIIDHPRMSEQACIMTFGYSKGSASRVSKRVRPEVAARRAKIAAEQDKALVKKLVVTRSTIEQRALALANLSVDETKGTATAQVNALRLLADMGGHIVQKTADVTEEFKNKSEEELEYFARNGYWPNLQSGGPSASGSQTEGTQVSQSRTTPN